MWEPSDYRVGAGADAPPDPQELRCIAARAVRCVARRDFGRPGFAVASFPAAVAPAAFRRLLLDFVAALDEAYRAEFGRPLALCSMGRFDQQSSTEAHLDGAPADSVLVLGYEPTPVRSRVSLYDYARAAADAGLDPLAYLERFNPTFGEGKAAIEHLRTDLADLDFDRHNVLVVNNSSRPLADGRTSGMIGVLHQSVIPVRRPGRHRFVNTLMLTPRGASPGLGLDPDAGGDADLGCDPDAVRSYVEAGSFATCR